MKLKYGFMVAVLVVVAPQAFAGGIVGTYKVLPAGFTGINENIPVCDLQENTTEKIDLSTGQLSMNLYIGDEIPGEGPWSLMFQATIGDVITRPTPDIVKLGYTTDDRQIASYDVASEEFKFVEYLYDMTLTDAQGLASGFFKSIVLRSAADGGVSYTKTYSDGEVYRCQLVPAQ